METGTGHYGIFGMVLWRFGKILSTLESDDVVTVQDAVKIGAGCCRNWNRRCRNWSSRCKS